MIETYPYESSDYLETDEDVAAFAAESTIDDDLKVVGQFVRTIVRAHGLTSLAAATGLPRRTLVEALSGEDPNALETLRAVLHATSARARPEAAE